MRVPLVSGAYQARSVVASAQRCVNMYPEKNPGDSQAPVPVVHYPTPGLRLLVALPTVATVRGLYRATNGDLFAVAGRDVFFIDNSWAVTKLGTIGDLPTPVSMADNGDVLVLVDGSTNGYAIDLTSHTFAALFADPAFYGSDRVDYCDTYFIFNRPGTRQFYISLSQVSFAMLTAGPAGSAFDPLDIVAKTGGADPLVAVIVARRELWVVGALTTEVWVNSGAADFTFQSLPGAFIDHGCVARYSLAKQDVSTFWLSQDREGRGIVVQGSGYQVQRISTHAIEADISSYSRIDDAIGYCYQQQGHAFYVLTFPTADRTWAYELSSGQWHELAWTDPNGGLHRHRANCCTFAYGANVIGDWQSGRLYALDPDVFTDDGNPVVRIRTFPHLVKDGKRITYQSFVADMQTGTLAGTTTANPPLVWLRWSDTRGASYGNPVTRSLGSAGQYDVQAKWWRLGVARDRVFELSWSAPVRTALLGAFIETVEHGS